MLASGRFFALMLGEGEELVPVLNRAVDCIGALALALMFSTIDDEIRIKSKLATKSDGGLRTRGGVAIQMLRQHDYSAFIFAKGPRARVTADLEAALKRQSAIRSRAEFEAATAADPQPCPDSPVPTPDVGRVNISRSPNLSRFVSLSEEEL